MILCLFKSQKAPAATAKKLLSGLTWFTSLGTFRPFAAFSVLLLSKQWDTFWAFATNISSSLKALLSLLLQPLSVIVTAVVVSACCQWGDCYSCCCVHSLTVVVLFFATVAVALAVVVVAIVSVMIIRVFYSQRCSHRCCLVYCCSRC